MPWEELEDVDACLRAIKKRIKKVKTKVKVNEEG